MFKYPQLLLILCLSLSFELFAQNTPPVRLRNTELTGRVHTSENNETLPGANVYIKGTTAGVATDHEGKFRLMVNPGDTIVFSCMGHKTREIPLGDRTVLHVTLEVDMVQMQEVLVVGYGTQERRSLTGSVSSIKGSDLGAISTSFDNAIIGKVAGVQVMSSSGVPGSATAMIIRGLSTLNDEANAPLVVIDGVPVYGAGRETNTTNFSTSTSPLVSMGATRVNHTIDARPEFERNPLASLNPDDIQSIEILKDAYATAIYGSRGASGVILVTTKRGRTGKPEINFRYETGSFNPIGTPKLLNGPQYNQIYTTYNQLRGQSNKVFDSPHNTNWLDEVSRTAISQEARMSVSAGNEVSNYYISGSYLNNPSYIINNDFERYTGRVNLNYFGSDRIRFGTTFSISFTDNNALNAQTVYRQAILKAPNLPITDDDGNYLYGMGTNPDGMDDVNPVAKAKTEINYLKDTRTTGNIYIEFLPIHWITLRSELGVDNYNSRAYNRQINRPRLPGGEAIESLSQNRKIVVNNTATFQRRFGNDHFTNSVIGQSFETSTEQFTSISGTHFFNDHIQSIGAAPSTRVRQSIQRQWALVSYFARLNYAYRNKYYAGITYRVDGSSRFSQNERYVGFPSFSAGWTLSEEAFMQGLSFVSELKIRGSLGFVGIQSSGGYYGNQGQYVINDNNFNYAGLPILVLTQPNNPNLKWERTRSVNAGVDISLFNSRIDIVYDYYHRMINNMLYTSNIPLYQGWASQTQNIGSMENYGMEFTVTSLNILSKWFSWSSSFNISGNRNRVLKLNFEGSDLGFAEAGYKYLREGEPAGQFYLFEWMGVDPLTGNPLWKDVNGEVSTVPPASRWRVDDDVNIHRRSFGTGLPTVYGGLDNMFTYSNFEFSFFVSFSYGSKMINGSRATLLTYSTEAAHNLSEEILDYWKLPGMQTDIPRLTNPSITRPYGVFTPSDALSDYTASRTSSRFLEDASYMRLRNVTLAYNFRPDQLQKVLKGMRTLRLYVTLTNLYTLTNYSGIDPEVSAFGSSALSVGYDELTMPQAKTVQFGINIGL
jgi:TonB-dependent starch-binding outer membrane protein SusC